MNLRNSLILQTFYAELDWGVQTIKQMLGGNDCVWLVGWEIQDCPSLRTKMWTLFARNADRDYLN